MERAFKIKDIPELDKTSAQVLRVIALKLGERNEAFVDFTMIAKSLNLKRAVVSSSVKRLVKNKLVMEEHGKLSMPASILVD